MCIRDRTECASDSPVQAGRVCGCFHFLLLRSSPKTGRGYFQAGAGHSPNACTANYLCRKTRDIRFFDLSLDDRSPAAHLFRPIHDRTNGVDGWVSLEVSPLLAHDTTSTIAAAKKLFARAGRPNLFIKIPGTKEGLPAIEEAIFAGVPVHVTLLFSPEQYVAAAEAYLRGIERRIAAGLNPQVGSVASMFISRWDAAVAGKVPEPLNNRLGIAIASRIYQAYLELLNTPRSQRAYNCLL